MAFKRYAVVKLDPPESLSTGGMVVDTIHYLDPSLRLKGKQYWAKKVNEYILVEIDHYSPVQSGWIYTDKTHQLIAP